MKIVLFLLLLFFRKAYVLFTVLKPPLYYNLCFTGFSFLGFSKQEMPNYFSAKDPYNKNNKLGNPTCISLGII